MIQFITVTRPAYQDYKAKIIGIRADLIIEMHPADDGTGTWLVMDRTGWMKVAESMETLKALIAGVDPPQAP